MSFITQERNNLYETAMKVAIKQLINNNINNRIVKLAIPKSYADNFVLLMKKLHKYFTTPNSTYLLQDARLRAIITKARQDEKVLTEAKVRACLHRWAKKGLDFFHKKLELPTLEKTYQYMKTLPTERRVATETVWKNKWREEKSINAEDISRKMLAGEMIKSDLPTEEALDYIRGYTYIRGDLRNHFNHATGNIPLHKVQNELNEYLVLLRKIHNRTHIHTGLWVSDTKEATK